MTEPPGVEERTGTVPTDAVIATEFYETDAGVVFYDAENPLAWIQSDRTIDLDSVA